MGGHANITLNISKDLERYAKNGVLDVLLKDHSTGKNIVWATSAYVNRGIGYEPESEITPDAISKNNLGVIKTRAEKAAEEQASLTKSFAEVFTPTWVCKYMIDEVESDNALILDSMNSIQDKRKYIRTIALEITCGEAPFITNRYDAVDGVYISFEKRTGILDRKLRVVQEIATSFDTWKKWALEALRSVYGYEYQGDNLLIARFNVLRAVEEAAEVAGYSLATATLKRFAETISHNFFQMDGLTYCVPFKALDESYYQPTLFDFLSAEEDNEETADRDPVFAKIINWQTSEEVEFRDLRGEGTAMKFDFIIGNPPYQEETIQKEVSTNRQKPSKNIFHYFQMQIDEIARKGTVLIYPGGRWIHRSGKGLKEFGLKQINDPHLAMLTLYANAKDLFPTVSIADGISIVVKNKRKTTAGFEYEYIKDGEKFKTFMESPGRELMPLDPRDWKIINKIDRFVLARGGGTYLHQRILPRSLFGIESDYIEKHPGVLRPFSGQFNQENEIKVFTNDRAGKMGRARWFVGPLSIIKTNTAFINEWQVVVSSANAGGQKRDRQLEVIDNHSVFGRSRVALGSFKTQEEAINFYNYVNSIIIRFAFLMTDEALSSLGKKVPDIGDYSSNNELIDFSRDIDFQLCELMQLTTEDMRYIKRRVENVRKK